MRTFLALFAMAMAASAAIAGPISKFDARPPDVDYETATKMEDVERCLIDIGLLAPTVYRQPDRPDDVTLLYPNPGPGGRITSARASLHRSANGTHVRLWSIGKEPLPCAPPL